MLPSASLHFVFLRLPDFEKVSGPARLYWNAGLPATAEGRHHSRHVRTHPYLSLHCTAVPSRGSLQRPRSKDLSPRGVDTAVCFFCPCRRPAYQYEAEHIEGAVNIPTFRPVAGRGKWDVIKKIAMGALAMKATGALHSCCWALGP